MSELLKCPCCKGVAVAENFIIEAAVRCTACGLTIKRPHDAVSDSGLAAAIASWNRRASPVQAEPVPQEAQPMALKTDEAALMVAYNRAKYSRSVDYQDFSAGWIAARQATPTASKDGRWTAEEIKAAYLKAADARVQKWADTPDMHEMYKADAMSGLGMLSDAINELSGAAMQEGGGKWAAIHLQK